MWGAFVGMVKENLNKTFVKPDEIIWFPNPALPAGAQEAKILGDPSANEDYVIRVRVPPGKKVMPHTHPEDRKYTVISGEFMIGIGDLFNREKLELLPPGSFVFLPGGTPHFQYSENHDYVIQIEGHGPISTDYVNREEDPRG